MEEKTKKGSMLLGFGLCALCNLVFYPTLALLLMPFSEMAGLYMALGIGIGQLVFLIPLIIRYKRRQQTATIQGILIGAGITFVLNGSCWGLCLGIVSGG